MPKLVITEEDATREVALNSGDTAGRVSQNAIQLSIAEASRQHCRFTEEQGSWFIEDLGSSNGTKVNGRKVTKFELQDGDTVSIGAASLRFLDIAAEPDEEEISLEGGGGWGDEEISLEQRIFLVLRGAGRDGEVLDLPPGRVTVGRHAKHAIRLKEASVSGEHATLVRDGDTVTVQDHGSSNGTFVNGAQVTESLLESGDEVRFGQVHAIFGVGDPADFQSLVSAPNAAPAASDEDDWETDRLDLDRVPAGKEKVWNILALVMVVALGGAAWFLLTQEGQGTTGPKPLVKGATNLLPDLAWSFEEAPEAADAEAAVEDEIIWERDRRAAGLIADTLRGAASSGESFLEVQRAEASADPGLAYMVRDGERVGTPVTEGFAYEITAEISSATAAPVLGVQWMGQSREDTSERFEIARDHLVSGGAEGSDWKPVRGVFWAPAGAVEARVGVGVLGEGAAQFDDLRMMRIETTANRIKAQEFVASVSPSGQLRLGRYNDQIVDGLGLMFKRGEDALDQTRALTFRLRDDAWSGQLRGGTQTLSAALDQREGRMLFRLTGEAVREACCLRIPLEAAGAQVTVLRAGDDGEVGQLFSSSFEGESATALILGPRTARVRLTLESTDGKTHATTASFVKEEGRAFVDLQNPGGETLVVALQFDFSKETDAARDLFAKAQTMRREGRNGQAVILARQLAARFPFEESLTAQMKALENQVMTEGQTALATCRQRVADAKFFYTLPEEADLLSEIQRHEKTFEGTSLASQFEALATEFEQALGEFLAPRAQGRAAVLLRRAVDYRDSSKDKIARLLLDTLQRNYKGTAEAAEALKILAQMGNEQENG